jgi:hypothetical protein
MQNAVNISGNVIEVVANGKGYTCKEGIDIKNALDLVPAGSAVLISFDKNSLVEILASREIDKFVRIHGLKPAYELV